ncbi:hypothetical protein ASPWEDRAFT_537728 [Aspergillus wentii DTO 134E9]|uniref:Uncharacterized protein n=1 Tax=Aspergillus wentii DTO 134E9 TaxID=1073089 RepID=A0A1L9RMP5_ASPWE|nr:uncharacterized protein ASPWEDRAFT_537728 [Aspergillus wentii DTO 134E9]OJJ36215.1 hypothetical protein ASPWEDRAFT_537728 [Aspergillus wentii DTO 134E9]
MYRSIAQTLGTTRILHQAIPCVPQGNNLLLEHKSRQSALFLRPKIVFIVGGDHSATVDQSQAAMANTGLPGRSAMIGRDDRVLSVNVYSTLGDKMRHYPRGIVGFWIALFRMCWLCVLHSLFNFLLS